MRKLLAILCVPFLAVACTKNPLGPGLSSAAPASSGLCQDRYNFQPYTSPLYGSVTGPQLVAAWTAPVGWCPPVADSTPVWDGTHSYCGNGAMKVALDMPLGGSIFEAGCGATYSASAFQGILSTFFAQTPGMPSEENATNAHVVMHIYFDQAPPAEMSMRMYFVDDQSIWVPSFDAGHLAGLHQGWNDLSQYFYVNSSPQLGDITHVVGFLIQIQDNALNIGNVPPYVANFWIGGITW